MAKPPKIAMELPEWLRDSTPEAQALGMQKRAVNCLLPHGDFLILQELAAVESLNSENIISVSDVVRAAIGKGLEEINQRHGGLVTELATRTLELQAAKNVLRNELNRN